MESARVAGSEGNAVQGDSAGEDEQRVDPLFGWLRSGGKQERIEAAQGREVLRVGSTVEGQGREGRQV